MTLCGVCNRYFMDADSCTVEKIKFPSGEVLDVIPYGDEKRDNKEEDCPDCGVGKGGYHHPGCDITECPKCNKKLTSCGCLDKK